jgi:hypothetical protein
MPSTAAKVYAQLLHMGGDFFQTPGDGSVLLAFEGGGREKIIRETVETGHRA